MAIAITLLVIDISIPVVRDEDVGRALTENWQSYFSFVLSFVVIGRYWFIHNRMFRHITRIDGTLAVLNFALLLCIAFLPFPTSVLGDHAESSAAVVAYAVTLACAALASSAIWLWASAGRRLIDDRLSDDAVTDFRIGGLAVVIAFVVSIPIALVAPVIAMLTWLLIPLWGRALAFLVKRRAR
jgi:uncharacterized membrane protein